MRRTIPLVLALLCSSRSAFATNFLVIVADDLGADKVGEFNWDGPPATLPSTPTLDDLAAAGIAFQQTWANPLCSPTRATLTTGEHAFRDSIGRALPNAPELAQDLVNHLPARLESLGLGYTTGLFGKWHLGETGSDPLADWTVAGTPAGDPPPVHVAGYDTFDGFVEGDVTAYDTFARVWDNAGTWEVDTTPAIYVDQSSVDAAATWIAAQASPWLAVVTLAAPHSSGLTGYPDADLTLDTSCSLLASPPYTAGCFGDANPNNCPDLVVYQGLVECMDERVGDFLVDLDANGDLTDTLVFFAGDNGTPRSLIQDPYDDPAGTHDFGKGTVYQSGVRVPMLVADGDAYAGAAPVHIVSPGRDVSSPTQVMDIYSTILDFVTAAPAVDAVSLVPCLSDTSSSCGGKTYFGPNRVLFAEEFEFETPTDPASGTESGSAAVLVGTSKMVATWDETSACMDTELFDLSVDPHELTDLDAATVGCKVTRGAFDVIGPTWMMNGGATIPWCATSCN